MPPKKHNLRDFASSMSKDEMPEPDIQNMLPSEHIIIHVNAMIEFIEKTDTKRLKIQNKKKWEDSINEKFSQLKQRFPMLYDMILKQHNFEKHAYSPDIPEIYNDNTEYNRYMIRYVEV